MLCFHLATTFCIPRMNMRFQGLSKKMQTKLKGFDLIIAPIFDSFGPMIKKTDQFKSSKITLYKMPCHCNELKRHD